MEIDDEISDPEVLAELEYAREHGQALPTGDTTDAAEPNLPQTSWLCWFLILIFTYMLK